MNFWLNYSLLFEIVDTQPGEIQSLLLSTDPPKHTDGCGNKGLTER